MMNINSSETLFSGYKSGYRSRNSIQGNDRIRFRINSGLFSFFREEGFAFQKAGNMAGDIIRGQLGRNASIGVPVKKEEPIKVKEIKVEKIKDIDNDILEYITELYKNDELYRLKYIGNGTEGVVYEYKNYAIKKLHLRSSDRSNDIQVLKDLQELDFIPNIYATINNDLLIVDRIYGEILKEYARKMDYKEIDIPREFAKVWDEMLLQIIKLGYSPNDLHSENVMIDENNNIKIIDVGWFEKHNDNYSTESEMRENSGYETAQSFSGGRFKRMDKERKEYISKLQSV